MLQGANAHLHVQVPGQGIGDAEKISPVSAGIVMKKITESRRLTECLVFNLHTYAS